MHPYKFFNAVTFVENTLFGSIVDTETTERLYKVHPAQVIGEIKVPLFKVVYSYITNKGNIKKHEKFIFLIQEHEDCFMEIEMKFDDWVKDYNASHPYRAISNVQILEVEPVAKALLRIGD